jgi:transcriptional regulator with XRE-family HTH domain
MAKKKIAFNVNKIKMCIAEKGITQEKLAKHLNITGTTLSIKMNTGNFKVSEIQEIANYFKKEVGYFFE